MFAIDRDFDPPCKTDPEIFFSKYAADIKRAKAKCQSCPIILICLQQALEYEELSGEPRHGIFGGLTVKERNKIKLERIA